MNMTIKEWVLKYRNYILFSVTMIISCILYWNYLIGHFAAETYGIASNYRNYAIQVYLVDGRIFSCLFLLIADKINIPVLMLMSISTFIAIIIASIAIMQLKNEISKLVSLNVMQEITVWFISYLTIFNFMMVEIMYFPESCIMVSSILCYVIASKFFIQKRYGYSFLLLVIGIFCYQGTIGFFAVCCMLFSIIKNKKIGKEVIKDISKIVLIGFIAAGLNLIFIKIVPASLNLIQYKAFSFNINVIKENIQLIVESIYVVLQNNCGLFPKNILLILIEIIMTFTLLVSYYEKEDKVVNLLVLLIITIASSFVLFIIQRGSMYTGRVHFCIGSLIGISLLYLYSTTNIKNEKIWKQIFLTIVIGYGILNCINTICLVTQHKEVNRLEKEECSRIENIIKQYENEYKTKIKKIAPILILNQEEKGYFKEINRRTIITYNNVRHYFGYSGIIQYYLKQGLQEVGLSKKSTDKYKQYIIENNLEYGDIVCIEDTLYCPQYLT